jgi:hypothetical protein
MNPVAAHSAAGSGIMGGVKIDELRMLADDLDVFAGAPLPGRAVTLGILPPLPVCVLSRPTLVWGWHIVSMAGEQGITDLDVRTVDLTAEDALSLALELEDRTGGYSLREQDRILCFAESHGITDRRRLSTLARGDGALEDQVTRYRALLPAGRELVDEGFISLKTAGRLADMPGDFVSAFRGRLEELSFSSRRQFLELAAELLRHPTTGSNPAETVAGALAASDPVASIRRARYPVLSGMQARFSSLTRELVGDDRVRIEPPPYFEGDAISISFSFRSRRELVEHARVLERVLERCDDLLGIL